MWRIDISIWFMPFEVIFEQAFVRGKWSYNTVDTQINIIFRQWVGFA